MTKPKTTAMELAQEHWKSLSEVLDVQRAMERKLFMEAFMQGYKKGKESK